MGGLITHCAPLPTVPISCRRWIGCQAGFLGPMITRLPEAERPSEICSLLPVLVQNLGGRATRGPDQSSGVPFQGVISKYDFSLLSVFP